MATLMVGILTSKLGVNTTAPGRGNSICDCCAATYEPHEYTSFYGINVSLLPPKTDCDQKTDEVILPSGDKLYITVATEPFEGGEDDDDY